MGAALPPITALAEHPSPRAARQPAGPPPLFLLLPPNSRHTNSATRASNACRMNSFHSIQSRLTLPLAKACARSRTTSPSLFHFAALIRASPAAGGPGISLGARPSGSRMCASSSMTSNLVMERRRVQRRKSAPSKEHVEPSRHIHGPRPQRREAGRAGPELLPLAGASHGLARSSTRKIQGGISPLTRGGDRSQPSRADKARRRIEGNGSCGNVGPRSCEARGECGAGRSSAAWI